jgi:hypothetical protein
MLIEKFPYSNEVWTDEVLDLARSASGEAEFVVGSGNVPNVAPLMDGLGNVCFMDIEPIHSEVFRKKHRAAAACSAYERNEILISTGCPLDAFNLETLEFDFTRPEGQGLHWMQNRDSADSFVQWTERSSVNPIDVEVDLFARRLPKRTFPNLGSVAWVHLSNVFPYCDSPRKSSKPKPAHLPRLLETIPGVKDDTLITFSTRRQLPGEDMPKTKRLVVFGRPACEITFEDLF